LPPNVGSTSLNVEVTQAVEPESRDAIARGLIEFNARHVGKYKWTNLDVYVRDAEGGIVGGLIGEFCLGWFSIHALWVAERLRGLGVGTKILDAAENAAIAIGCSGAILDTFSFQGYWGGAQRIFLQKRLPSDSAALADV
jgi:GNAT superfamily N-acetyltransferase